MDNKGKMRKGISLIVLVITIIVIIVLSTAVIVTLVKNNPISAAKNAKELNNQKVAEEKMKLLLGDWLVKNTQYGTTLLEFLTEELVKKEIEDFEYNDETEIFEVTIEDRLVTLDKYGNILKIEKSGPRPVISNLKIVNSNDEEVPKKSIEVGTQKIYIKFNVSIDEGSISSVKYEGKEIEPQDGVYILEVASNGSYEFDITGIFNNETISKTRTIAINQYDTLPDVPVIKSNVGYPVITEYGVKNSNEVNIEFDKTMGIKNYYSYDGNDWIEYTGSIEGKANQTIYAKSVKEGGLASSSNQTLSVPADVLRKDAYDGNETTGVTLHAIKDKKYMMLTPGMSGKKIYVSAYKGRLLGITLAFTDENKNNISEIELYDAYSENVTIKKNFNVPENAKYVTLYVSDLYNSSVTSNLTIYEMYCANEPTFSVTQSFPELTSQGVEKGCCMVTINYHNTSVEKLYSFDNTNWQNYENKAIRVEVGQTIYAKGVDSSGIDSKVSSYKASQISDALDNAAYDGDETTGISFSYDEKKYIKINPEMVGKTVYIYANKAELIGAKLTFTDENKTSISEIALYNRYSSAATIKSSFTIPENAKYFTLYVNDRYNSNVKNQITIYEIK